MKKRALVAVVAVLFLAGCSAADPAPAPTVTVTHTITETVTPTPAPPVEPLAIGVLADAGYMTVAVHAVDAASAPDAPAPESANSKWASVDVEVCNTSNGEFSTSSTPWRLVGNENLRFEPASIGYNQFPEPDYTFGEEVLSPGDCRRGWVTFAVTTDATLTGVNYTSSEGFAARWAV